MAMLQMIAAALLVVAGAWLVLAGALGVAVGVPVAVPPRVTRAVAALVVFVGFGFYLVGALYFARDLSTLS